MAQKKTTIPALILLIAALGALWFFSAKYVSLTNAKIAALELIHFAQNRPIVTALAIGCLQMIGMALSLPTKAVINILAGSLLGFWLGTISTLLGVIAGTTLLFWAVRKFFQDKASAKFGEKAVRLDQKLSHRPLLTMAGLRLVITLPYGPITVMAALTHMDFRKFLAGSILGDLPVIALYSIAGQRLGTLTRTSDAISPWTMAIFIGAGICLLAGALAGKIKRPKKESAQ